MVKVNHAVVVPTAREEFGRKKILIQLNPKLGIH
jgi:hypothetical protein